MLKQRISNDGIMVLMAWTSTEYCISKKNRKGDGSRTGFVSLNLNLLNTRAKKYLNQEGG